MKNIDNHEYYSNAETCRNRWFDYYDEQPQNEDFHLSLSPDQHNSNTNKKTFKRKKSSK